MREPPVRAVLAAALNAARMRPRVWVRLAVVGAAGLLLLRAGVLLAQTLPAAGAGSTAAGGALQAGGYTLQSAIGQAEAASWSGGGYTLTGGLLPAESAVALRPLFLPLLMR